MPQEILILSTRYIAIFVLVVSIALIIVRWRFPLKEDSNAKESSFAYWRRVYKQWRKIRAAEQEREKDLRAVRRKTALIVDPDEKSSRVLAWKLESLGCKVVKARAGTQALSAMDKSRPDFIIADALLPDISAVDFFKSLQMPGLPVVFVGVLDGQRGELKMLGDEVICFPKPFDPEKAVVLVGRIFRNGGNLTPHKSPL